MNSRRPPNPTPPKGDRGLHGEEYRIFMLSQLTPPQVQALTSSLARAKFAPYRRVFGGATKQASQLFLLDCALAGSFQELLRIIELTMRESMHRELTNTYGHRWMFTQEILNKHGQAMIANAVTRVGPKAQPGQIIAEITLGGWVAMLQQGGFSSDQKEKYVDYSKTLWTPALNKAFSNGAPEQTDVAKIGQRLRYLRNRVAHHESLVFGITQTGIKLLGLKVKQRPESAHRDICALAGFMNTELGAWLTACRDVESILAHPLMVKAQNFSENNSEYHWI